MRSAILLQQTLLLQDSPILLQKMILGLKKKKKTLVAQQGERLTWVCAKPLPVKEVAEKEQQAGTNTKKSSRPVVFNMGKSSAGGTSVGLKGVSLRAADVVKNGIGRDVPNEEVATKIAQALAHAQNKEPDPVHSSLNLAGRISQLGELRAKSAGQMKKMPKRSGAAH
eukprot:g19876.t1